MNKPDENGNWIGVYDGPGGPSLQLLSGALLSFLNPDPSLIALPDLAHVLSMLCRYTGHIDMFYSVAQHCVMVSRLVPDEHALAGLLHDAEEAFLGDLSRPLKKLIEQLAPGVLDQIRGPINDAIAERFGLALVDDDVIKAADNVALATEVRDLGKPRDAFWNLPEPSGELRAVPLNPFAAKAEFIGRYHEITGRWD